MNIRYFKTGIIQKMLIWRTWSCLPMRQSFWCKMMEPRGEGRYSWSWKLVHYINYVSCREIVKEVRYIIFLKTNNKRIPVFKNTYNSLKHNTTFMLKMNHPVSATKQKLIENFCPTKDSFFMRMAKNLALWIHRYHCYISHNEEEKTE